VVVPFREGVCRIIEPLEVHVWNIRSVSSHERVGVDAETSQAISTYKDTAAPTPNLAITVTEPFRTCIQCFICRQTKSTGNATDSFCRLIEDVVHDTAIVRE